ncbi:MAG: S-layer homology domain-containing protein, partial [bacterium]
MGTQNRFWRTFLATALAALLLFLPSGWVLAQDSNPTAYTDLSGHSGEAEIRSLLDAGILEIEPDGKFHPDQPFTRLSFLPPLARVSRLNSTTPTYPVAVRFTDVPLSNYAYPDLLRILQTALYPDRIFRGIAEGTTLKPDLPLTVAEGLALIVRSRGWVHGVQLPGSSPFA